MLLRSLACDLLPGTKEAEDRDVGIASLGAPIGHDTVDQGVMPASERALPSARHISAGMANERQGHQPFGCP